MFFVLLFLCFHPGLASYMGQSEVPASITILFCFCFIFPGTSTTPLTPKERGVYHATYAGGCCTTSAGVDGLRVLPHDPSFSSPPQVEVNHRDTEKNYTTLQYAEEEKDTDVAEVLIDVLYLELEAANSRALRI